MRRVLSPTFKQHGPCVETTSRQDNTHYVPQQHTGVLNLHPVMCIGVLYCPPCVKITHEMRYKCCFNTCSSKQHTMVTLMWVISTWLFLQCGFQHGVPCTWQLPWLAVEKSWLALAGPFLTMHMLAQTCRLRNHSPQLVEAPFQWVWMGS